MGIDLSKTQCGFGIFKDGVTIGNPKDYKPTPIEINEVRGGMGNNLLYTEDKYSTHDNVYLKIQELENKLKYASDYMPYDELYKVNEQLSVLRSVYNPNEPIYVDDSVYSGTIKAYINTIYEKMANAIKHENKEGIETCKYLIDLFEALVKDAESNMKGGR